MNHLKRQIRFRGIARNRQRLRISILFLLFSLLTPAVRGQVNFQSSDNELKIQIADQTVARYVFRDPKIPRPYYADVKTLDGLQVTRNHPPVENQDPSDHADMHPGIWLAFGDISGTDFWRNKGQVRHVRFLTPPTGGADSGSFTEEKHYLRQDGTLICREVFRCRVAAREQGYLLLWESQFESAEEFYFGDQEEMGLGIRVATPLSEVKGGQLRDSESRVTAKQIWSHAARWCDYSGKLGPVPAGMTLLTHPDNFRPSWLHARNYGLVVANAFGRAAMHKGRPSKLTVSPGESLRLRYGVWVYSGHAHDARSLDRIHESYVSLQDE